MVRVLASVVGLALWLSAQGPAYAGDPVPDEGPGAPDADADRPSPDPKEAKRWMNAGDTLIKRGDQLARRNKAAEAQSQYERALVSYQKALELTGNVQVYYAIAAAEEKLGKQTDALLHYRKVAVQVTDNPQLVELATGRLAALSQDVGLFTATIDPAGAELAIDGTSIGTSPMPEPVVLQPGTYSLQISADGYQPLEVKLEIEAGSESERTFKLEPIAVVFEKPKEAPRPVVRKVIPPPSTALLWIGGTAALVFTGVATTTGVVALSKHNTFKDPQSTQAERDAARDSGKKLSLATDLCLIGAVVAAGFTTYYYFSVYRPKARAHRRKPADRRARAGQERESGPKVVVAPWVQPSIGGLAVAVTY